MTNYEKSKEWQLKQSNLVDILSKKYNISDKDHQLLAEIINLEYRLTMLDEGHDYTTL
jgi:hypothetical protein